MTSHEPTYDDANLILRLYEMRREDRMRKARAWFTAKCKAEELRRAGQARARRQPTRTRRSGW